MSEYQQNDEGNHEKSEGREDTRAYGRCSTCDMNHGDGPNMLVAVEAQTGQLWWSVQALTSSHLDDCCRERHDVITSPWTAATSALNSRPQIT